MASETAVNGLRTSASVWTRRALAFAGVLGLLVVAETQGLAGNLTLQQVEVMPGDSPVILLHLDQAAEGSAVSAFTQSGPDRLVIDIADTTANPEVREVVGDGSLVQRAEVTTFDDGTGLITRVTLYLAAPVDHRIATDGDTVRVTLNRKTGTVDAMAEALESGGATVSAEDYVEDGSRPLSGPERIAVGPAITSLDMQSLDAVTRVIIGLKGTTEYSTSQPQSNLLVVDIPGAFLPRSLQRVLDASEFVSPIRMVRAYRTSTGTRVAISLRTTTDYNVRLGEGGLLFVDVNVPGQMRSDREAGVQSYATVSPSTGDEGIHNASQSEILISGSGNTVNPQSAFGTGGGSNDPSSLIGMASGFDFDTSTAGSLPYSGRRISLDFVNADIHSIFRLISNVSRLNIVAGDDVKGTVTVRMVDVPWDQALAAILQAKGLGSQRFGNIVRVAPIETIKSEQQAALEAKRAKEELTDLEVLILPLNYIQADDLKVQVGSLISTRGSVEIDTAGNQLIVKETAARLAQIRELVRHIDKQTPQVLIEARVVEANSNYTRMLGVQWGAELEANTRTGYSTGLFFPNGVNVAGGITQEGANTFYDPTLNTTPLLVDLGADSSTSSIAFSLGSIPGLFDLDARLSAMESDGWGKVVSSPRVTTLDNKSARIAQGQRVPYLSTSSGGTQVKFIEATLELQVTPHITTDDKVFLAVTVTNNRADFSQLVQGQPAIQVKEAETELLVADGDTTVLGGVFSTEQSFSQDRVPGLGKIPLIGYLFRNSTESTTRNELLVFITPHIVSQPKSNKG